MRINLALTLSDLKTPGNSVENATVLITKLRDAGFDIVHKDWVNGTVTTGGALTWEDMAANAEKIEEAFGRKPWMP